MNFARRFFAVATAVAVATASLAHGQSPRPALATVEEIDRPMLWVAMAIEISDRCASITPRTLKGLAKLNGLRLKAKSMGYTDTEISAYVQSDAEKARMRALGAAYMKSKGLSPTDPTAMCTLGHAEIARNSEIGVLLKAK